tara:strand:+ start:1287 stop:1721 length:435 start_codon:yes stop_codon:yes gene_type:complete
MTAAADKIVADTLRKKGWEVLDKGWPDLLVYDKETRRVMAIELKRGNDGLRPEQREMGLVFSDLLGVPFYVARDKDIEAMLRKKGRVIVPSETLSKLENALQDIKFKEAIYAMEIKRLEEAINRATMVFEELDNGREPAFEFPA